MGKLVEPDDVQFEETDMQPDLLVPCILPTSYSDHVKKINEIIEETYGPRFKANVKWIDGYCTTGGKLGLIVEPNIRYPVYVGSIAGQLGIDGPDPTDGSVIVANEDFLRQADRYAQLYEREFGKKVTIYSASRKDLPLKDAVLFEKY